MWYEKGGVKRGLFSRETTAYKDSSGERRRVSDPAISQLRCRSRWGSRYSEVSCMQYSAVPSLVCTIGSIDWFARNNRAYSGFLEAS